jgi:hypothetical protein
MHQVMTIVLVLGTLTLTAHAEARGSDRAERRPPRPTAFGASPPCPTT